MTGSKDQPGRLLRFPEAEQPTLYETLGGILQGVLMRRFELSQTDAELLIRDTFISLETLEEEPDEPRKWLIDRACRSARAHQQEHSLTVRDEEDDLHAVKQFLSHRTTAEILPTRTREAVRLRFLEHKTYQEIAEGLDISRDTATRLVAKGVVKIRKLLRMERAR
jgi:RNA polymerase sigma factor (sigma-70 family)